MEFGIKKSYTLSLSEPGCIPETLAGKFCVPALFSSWIHGTGLKLPPLKRHYRFDGQFLTQGKRNGT